MNNGFLKNTAYAIIEKHGWSNMDDLTLVFPSRRAGVVLKDLLKQYQTEHKACAILLPNITTLSDLFESLCPKATIEELEAVFRLYKIYEEKTQEYYKEEKLRFEQKEENTGKEYDKVKPFNLDVFYSWGRQLLSDFNNIDSSDAGTLESVREFFENAIQAKKLENPEIDEEVRERLKTLIHNGEREASQNDDSIRKKYEAIWRCMDGIYTEFHESLKQDGKVTSGMQKRWVIENWEEAKEKCERQQYIFIGFNYLLPVEKELFEKIKEENENTEFYWDYVEDFNTNKKAYAFIKQNIEQFGNAAEPSTWNKKEINIVAATSANAQAQYVSQWLHDHYTAKGQRTAVVICDEQMLEPVIYALPALTIGNDPAEVNINITKGFPISSTQIYSDVIAYLSDTKNDCKAGEDYTTVIKRVLDEVVNKTDPTYSESVRTQKAQDKETENTWQTLLIEESIYQVQLQLNQLYNTLSNPAYKGLVNSLALLRSIVRRTMESVSLPFHGEPITDIQVMGVLETRALDFDNLLLLNVEEGVVPRKKNDSSFIPYYLRKLYKMQTRDEEASVYAYNFFRLLNRAKHITAVFSNAQTQLGAKTMSRFLMQIMTSEEFETVRYTLQESTMLGEAIELVPAKKNLLSKLVLGKDGYYYKAGETKPFCLSPSALNTYIQCPRQFYLKYIEGLREEDKQHTIFESNEIGTFVHGVLERIYRDIFGVKENSRQPIDINARELENIEKNKDQITEILRKVYDDQNKKYEEKHPNTKGIVFYEYDKHPAENDVIVKLVQKVLRHDKKEARDKGLKMVALEQPGYYDIDIKVKDLDGQAHGKIKVGGTIDRLDIYDGTMRVVDYKTGGYKVDKLALKKDKLVTDPAQHYVLQTLIYSEAVAVAQENSIQPSLPIQPNLFFTQSNLENTPVTYNNNPVDDYNKLRNEISSIICEKINEVLNTTEFPQCDENKCTSFCPFLDICSRELGYKPNK